MSIQNKLCFVQFIHPGGEARPDSRAFKRWNRLPHKRKFIKQPGRYVTDNNIHDGHVAFWGEWEPESRVVKEILNPIPNGPRYIYEPFYVEPASYQGLQNTDPSYLGISSTTRAVSSEPRMAQHNCVIFREARSSYLARV